MIQYSTNFDVQLTENLIKKYGNDLDGVLAYAETRMLPYYASYAPTALQDF